MSERGEPLGFRHPQIQRLRRLLGRRSARLDEGAFVVEGAGLVAEAASAGWELEAQFLGHDAPAEVALAGVATHRLAPGVLERVASTVTPRPLLAIARIPVGAGLPTGRALLLVADRIGDPGNLGTVLRSAEAAGFDAVVTTPGTVDAYNPKVVRASAGALFHVPLVATTLGELGTQGFRVLGTSSHRGTPHTDVDWAAPERLAVVLGNEANGLDDDAAVDDWVTIAHHGRAESLNVAMAATLLCFEAASARSR